MSEELRWPLSRVVLMGQSIGSGPCCWAASWLNRSGRHLAGVVLQSPFTSIRDIVRDLVGSAAASLVAERWNSLQLCVDHINDPILFLHGMKDELITCSHSERLYDRCQSAHKHLLLIPEATHNEFNLLVDVVSPIVQFLQLYTSLKDRQRHSRPARDDEEERALLSSSSLSTFTGCSSSPRSSLISTSSNAMHSLSSVPSDTTIRLRLARSKRVTGGSVRGSTGNASPRSGGGDVGAPEVEFLRGDLGEEIPLCLAIPKRFTTVPASAIAFHLRKEEAKRREEEAQRRAKERKEYLTGLWERGKASILSWGRPTTPSASHTSSAPHPHPAPPLHSPSRPLPPLLSSVSPPRSGSSSSHSSPPSSSHPYPAVSLPTAVPVPSLPSRASSNLSICVATAVKAAKAVPPGGGSDPASYSSPRGLRRPLAVDPSTPSPSPSLSSHQQSRSTASQSQSQSHWARSHQPHSPSLQAGEEEGGVEDKEGGDRGDEGEKERDRDRDLLIATLPAGQAVLPLLLPSSAPTSETPWASSFPLQSFTGDEEKEEDRQGEEESERGGSRVERGGGGGERGP